MRKASRSPTAQQATSSSWPSSRVAAASTVAATIQKWTGSAWGAAVTPTAGQFYGLTNDGSIPVGPWTDAIASGGLIPVRQFGEMAFDLTSLGIVLTCPSEGFGELNVRTRSAISASAEIKDYASAPIDFPSTCGELSWQKQDGAGQPLGGAVFTLTPNPWTGTGSVDIADLTSGSPASNHVDQDNRPGFFRLIDVAPGTYSLQEKTAPAGYLLDPTVKTTTVSEFEHATFGYVWADPAQVPPTIMTTSSASTADFGVKVHDDATLTGTVAFGPASGTVDFHLCGPTVAAANCTTGGTDVGSVPVTTTASGGTATSPDYTVGVTAAASGYYCWRANYTPDANSLYLAGSHTNATTECFFVAPATIKIVKTANPAGPVSAGDPVGFDLTVSNEGTQTTLGVHVTDALPASVAGWAFDAPTGTDTAGITCGISAGTLTCDKATLAAGKSFTVHIHGTSSTAACPSVSNSAHVGTTNDGSGDSGASVVVNCPDVKVTKTPDGGTINAGEVATFSIKVENIGAGTAKAVTLHDALPGTAAVNWTTGDAGCAITGAPGSQVLDCTVGDLAPGASKTYTVSADLAGTTFCAALDNSATATATNEASGDLANNTDTGSISVLCASISITKVADKGSVSAGDPIGFLITVTSNGPGEAKGVAVTDTLPTDAGTSWTIDGGTAAGSCGIAAGILSCDLGNLASGQVRTVHITSPTTSATVASSPVSNTAVVTTTNDGTATDTDEVVVLGASISITKVADKGSVSAGDPIGFLITVTSNGPGEAKGVAVTDTLPTDAGTSWTIDGGTAAGSCGIAAGILSCDLGNLASGQVRTVHITSPTTSATVATSPVSNTAVVTTTNDGTATDTDEVVVLGASIAITKVADKGSVSAGDPIGFLITVTSNGPGEAKGVKVSDTLPTDAGTSWSIDAANSDAGWTISRAACSPAAISGVTLASGASVHVHITSPTTRPPCPTARSPTPRSSPRPTTAPTPTPTRWSCWRPTCWSPRPPMTARSARATPRRSRSSSRTSATASPAT